MASSSLAGPSSHAFSAFPAHSRQISTGSRRPQDQDAKEGTPATPVVTTPTPGGPITTTTTNTTTNSMSTPATPILPSGSSMREMSVDVGGSVNGSVLNGTGEMGPPGERRREPKESVVADLEVVRARTVALCKKHGRGEEEEEAMVQTAARIAARLAEDQRAALFPDVDNPFVDEVDVVKRLLPYHVFQQPREDLDVLVRYGNPLSARKGKRKATEEDLLREGIADTKFALECWRRKRALERRFRKARLEPGKRASPDEQAYILAQAVLEVERAENIALNAELRAARAELDKLEKEKRAAAPPPSTPKPTPTVRTASSSSYYSSSTTTTPTTATFMPPYRPPYSYSYTQYPSTQYSYNPYTTYTPTTTIPYGNTASQTPTTPTTYNPPASAAGSTPTSAASAQVQQAQTQPSSAISNAAIPVQLPVSSLPALAALGIIPVAAASLPPAGQQQPPAVIKSTNGSMLNLEINLSLLQSAQMSGLVLILNALTSRGVNVDGSAAAAAAASGTKTTTNGSNGAAAPSVAAASATAASAGSAAAGASSSSSSSGSTSSASPSAS